MFRQKSSKTSLTIISLEAYSKKYIKTVIDNYFNSSYKNMVSFFAKEEKIATAELREILAIESTIEKNNHLWKHFLFISQNHQA